MALLNERPSHGAALRAVRWRTKRLMAVNFSKSRHADAEPHARASVPSWRSASPMTIAAATATLSERAGGAMGMRKVMSAAAKTASGTPADSRPARRMSPGWKTQAV
jgi:hypothetical protein